MFILTKGENFFNQFYFYGSINKKPIRQTSVIDRDSAHLYRHWRFSRFLVWKPVGLGGPMSIFFSCPPLFSLWIFRARMRHSECQMTWVTKIQQFFSFFTKCQFVINCISCFHEVWVQSSLHDQAVVVNEWWFYLKHYTIWAKSHLVSPVYLSMVALYRASSHIRFSLFVTKYSSFLGCKWQRSWPSLVSKTELSRNFWVLPSVGCQCLGCALSCSPDETYNCRLHKSIASSSSKQPTHNLDK